MGISRRQYAAHRGCVESAVRKAIATGRITPEPDGSIDPAKADAQWDRQTDPSRQRGPHAKELGARMAATTRAATKAVPTAAIRAVAETLQEAGAEPEPGEAGTGEVSFLRARMANEVLKAQTAKVRLQKMKGDLVDRARTTGMVFDLARRERDSWLNLPPRVAANMAAELGVEAHRMELLLDAYLRAHLAEMAEVRIELR
jgi:hypothetical protein